jgi:hydroxymethylpyrimidine/phosphomethylpyrimidine kinase
MLVHPQANAERPTSNVQHSIESVPVALTIAGSDSSAGAGIQADLKTFSALGVYGLTAVTCIVAEIPGKVSRIEPASAAIVHEQIELLTNFPIDAIKTGLLCSAEIISAVAQAIRSMDRNSASRVPVVIDPVIVATSGDMLLEPAAIEAYEKELFPLASLITPNLDEAERLLRTEIRDRQAMHRAGKELEREFGTAILVKGGHLRGRKAVDVLFIDRKVIEFSAPKAFGVATHGTGCTYSAAITAALASGLPLEQAIRSAKKFVTKAISRHLQWKRGSVEIDALNHSS